MSDARPLVMHVVYGFDTGGLENGIVNLVNNLPTGRFRHAIVALTRCAPTFSARIRREDVTFIELDKPPGHAFRLYPRLLRLFREHRPAIVHTRNLAALESQLPACLARVPARIHGEHGWDVADPNGAGRKNRFLRRLYKPFVQRYIALSGQLEDYLVRGVGVSPERVCRICNGVDVHRFTPAREGRELLLDSPFNASGLFVFGTVGRLQAVKDQLGLVRAFAKLLARGVPTGLQPRLMIAGDGPLRATLEAEVATLGLEREVWLAGERGDVPDVMRAMDAFVLPSLAEGISNTVLEAMASGLPIIATRVGGNAELVVEGETGWLVPPAEPDALAEAMAEALADPAANRARGLAGRARAEAEFSLERMVDRYQAVYEAALAPRAR